MRVAVIPYEGPFVCEGSELRRFWNEQILDPKLPIANPLDMKRGELLGRVIEQLRTFGPLEHWQICVQLDADPVKVRGCLGYLVTKKRAINENHKYRLTSYKEAEV